MKQRKCCVCGKNYKPNSGRQKYCKKCRIPRYNLKKNLKKFYGLTLDDYNALLKQQKGVCAICKDPPTKQRLCVDHNHITGEIRGLLCRECNLLLSCINDDINVFRKISKNVVNYLTNSNV